MNKIDSFIYNTVQIECPKTDGKTYLGTGFFVQFNPQKDGVTSEPIKLLLTNRHVMENAIALTLKFCVKNTDGSPNNQSHLSIYIPDIQNHVINHPNKDVDLCAIPHSILKKAVDDKNSQVFATCFPINNFLPIEDMGLSAIEDVISLGYPRTRIDKYNNKPIVRKGITATHPGLKYDGQDVFLVDIPCYKGCSGSPVFLYSPFIKYDSEDEKNIVIDHKIELLGIIYKAGIAEFEGNITGIYELKDKDNDKDKTPTANLQLPVNLGLVINRNQILILLLEAAKFLTPTI